MSTRNYAQGRVAAFTLVELMICLVMVAMLMVVAIGMRGSAAETANRARCVNNLKQIGLALRTYETQNQVYPRGPYKTETADKPVWGTGAAADATVGTSSADTFGSGKDTLRPDDNDITAAFYMLIRTQDMPSECFICPTTKLKPWDYGGGTNKAEYWTNWNGNDGIAKHLSYGFQNMYASSKGIGNGFSWGSSKLTSEFAIASDMSPGGDAVMNVTATSAPDAMKAANSLNHHGEGQNVLFGDCHAEWKTTPFCGVNGDNIFTARTDANSDANIGGAGAAILAVGSPASDSDSILLPTAADVGYKGPPEQKPVTPEMIDKLKKEILGSYTRSQSMGGGATSQQAEKMIPLTLTIDEKQVVLKGGPIVATFDYTLKSVDEDGSVTLQVSGPDIDPEEVTLSFTEAGAMKVEAGYGIGSMLRGEDWKKQ